MVSGMVRALCCVFGGPAHRTRVLRRRSAAAHHSQQILREASHPALARSLCHIPFPSGFTHFLNSSPCMRKEHIATVSIVANRLHFLNRFLRSKLDFFADLLLIGFTPCGLSKPQNGPHILCGPFCGRIMSARRTPPAALRGAGQRIYGAPAHRPC